MTEVHGGVAYIIKHRFYRNVNATVDVLRYKARQYKKLKNQGTMKVGEISKKVQERRWKGYGHAMRRQNHYLGKGDGNGSTREEEKKI